MIARAFASVIALVAVMGIVASAPPPAARIDGPAAEPTTIVGRVTCALSESYVASLRSRGFTVEKPVVTVTTSRNRVLASVTTDDDGRFRVPLAFDGEYTVVATQRGCEESTLARVPRGAAVTFDLRQFFWSPLADRQWIVEHTRTPCGAFQPTQPVLTYVVRTNCNTGIGF